MNEETPHERVGDPPTPAEVRGLLELFEKIRVVCEEEADRKAAIRKGRQNT